MCGLGRWEGEVLFDVGWFVVVILIDEIDEVAIGGFLVFVCGKRSRAQKSIESRL